ncbi:MAG: DDE-type integrase/transposase/recombinase [Aeriscardovia sp.]|nr:DDE-type integrase/transposase/recombinase [Aeriscardovia sp.]
MEEGGRFYVVHPDTGKCTEVPEDMAQCLKSRYVTGFTPEGDRITYSEDFYPELAKRMDEGMKPIEAYESLGFSVKVLGRDRANNACRRAKAKQKTEEPSGNPGDVQESALADACKGNPYVRRIATDRIYYTEGFFTDLVELLDNGRSPLEAYETLGFPVDKLGKERAYKAAKHARERKEKQAEAHFSLGDYDGTVPLADMMAQWGKPVCQTQWEAYLMARVIAMEKREEALKKKDIFPLGEHITLEARPNVDMLKIAYDFIHSGEAKKLGITNAATLRLFGVNKNSYSSYCKRIAENAKKAAERAREKEEQEKRDKEIMLNIKKIIQYRNGQVPGKRLLQWYYLLFFSDYLSQRACAKYLKKMGLVGSSLRKNPYQGQDTYYHQCFTRPNLLMQHFYLGFRKVILTDITYFFYDLGRKVCYHCFFYDPYMDQVLGEYTSETMDVNLVKEAYSQMMDKWGNELRGQVFVFLHSDNGSQFLETSFAELLKNEDFIRSFSRRATPGDNRPCEAKNSRIKLALSNLLLRCPTFEQAKKLVTNYHKDCNEKEINMNLGGLSPNQYYEYIVTGVYPLEKYYHIPASDFYPIQALLDRGRKKLEERNEKSKKEYKAHSKELEALKDIMKGTPDKIVMIDHMTVVTEHIQAEARVLAADTDLKIWEELEEKVSVAVKFIAAADEPTLEKLKDRAKWMEYPELSYVKDFPIYAKGTGKVKTSSLSKNMAEVVELWMVMEKWISKMVEFVTCADKTTRKALAQKGNWKNYKELSLLAMMEEQEEG